MKNQIKPSPLIKKNNCCPFRVKDDPMCDWGIQICHCY